MHITTVFKTDSQGTKRNYYRLCESYRTSCGQPRKRMLCALGYLEELPELRDRMLLLRCIEDLAYHGQRPLSGNPTVDQLTYLYYERITSNGKLTEIQGLMKEYHLEQERRGIEEVNLSTLKNIDPREIGAEHISVSTLKRLHLREFLLGKGWSHADVVNTDGMLVRTHIFEGNTGDCTTMQQIMASLVKEQIRKGKKKEDITVVMDAGISTKENIEYLKNNNFKFITVARSTGTKYKSAEEGIQTVLDNKKQEIRLEKVKVEGSTDSYLLVDSKAKTLKERSMYDRSCAYFEEGLKAIQNGIEKKGGTKKLDKVCERLGRLKEECPAVGLHHRLRP